MLEAYKSLRARRLNVRRECVWIVKTTPVPSQGHGRATQTHQCLEGGEAQRREVMRPGTASLGDSGPKRGPPGYRRCENPRGRLAWESRTPSVHRKLCDLRPVT